MNIIIKKGKHTHSNWFVHIFNYFAKGDSKWTYQFDSSAIYQYVNNDSEDWNKLHGVASHKSMHNEAIIVWKPDFKSNKIRIAFYARENGRIWIKELINKFDINTTITSSIKAVGGGYYFQCNNEYMFLEHSNPQGSRQIQPYFGGNNKAPHDISIKVINLK